MLGLRALGFRFVASKHSGFSVWGFGVERFTFVLLRFWCCGRVLEFAAEVAGLRVQTSGRSPGAV